MSSKKTIPHDKAMNHGKIRVYACGGGGVNIGSILERLKNQGKEIGFAVSSICYIDTSESNLANVKDDTMYYHIPDANGDKLDGSGQVRRENLEVIATHIKPILMKFEPMDINIVIGSGGGGSGSVIAPSIVSELKRTGQNVFVIIVGDTSTELLIKNTIDTIKSYDYIASNVVESPIVACYLENNSTTSRSDVDRKIEDIFLALSILFSRQNEELDSKDLNNWLNYTNIPVLKESGVQPKLCSFQLCDATNVHESVGDLTSVLTCITLAADKNYTKPDLMISYNAEGFPPPSISVGSSLKFPFFYMVVDGQFNQINRHLEEKKKAYTKQRESRIGTQSLLSGKETIASNGLVI